MSVCNYRWQLPQLARHYTGGGVEGVWGGVSHSLRGGGPAVTTRVRAIRGIRRDQKQWRPKLMGGKLSEAWQELSWQHRLDHHGRPASFLLSFIARLSCYDETQINLPLQKALHIESRPVRKTRAVITNMLIEQLRSLLPPLLRFV